LENVTIKDIAQKAGVSHTTVSRALNDSSLISEKTKKAIRDIADKMNYVPNLSAKSLVRVRSYNIGVFFSSLVEATSSDFVYTIIKSVSGNVPTQYSVLFNGIDKLSTSYDVTSANYDGVLVISQRKDDDVLIERIRMAGVPVVVINRKLEDAAIDNVYCDEASGISEAVAYLIANGHRDIAYVKGSESSMSTVRRYEGFIKEMEKQGVLIHEEWVLAGDYSAESGYQGMKKLLQNEPRPTAVMLASDAVAFGAMRAVRELGYHIPRDISLVGFDDGFLAAYSYPPLTSISRPIEKMASEGSKQLLDLIENKEHIPKQICYPVTLSVKASIQRRDDSKT